MATPTSSARDGDELLSSTGARQATCNGVVDGREQKYGRRHSGHEVLLKDASQLSLLFMKHNVYVHPTSRSRDQIPGRLALVESHKGVVCLNWLPYVLERTKKLTVVPLREMGGEEADGEEGEWENCCYSEVDVKHGGRGNNEQGRCGERDGTRRVGKSSAKVVKEEEDGGDGEDAFVSVEKSTNPQGVSGDAGKSINKSNGSASTGCVDAAGYAINVPLCELKSFRKVVPKMGWTHVVFTLRDGVTLSPLYFHEGGLGAVNELIEYLSDVVYVSTATANDGSGGGSDSEWEGGDRNGIGVKGKGGDPNLYLVNEYDKMGRSFQQLEIGAGPSPSTSGGGRGAGGEQEDPQPVTGLLYDVKESLQWNFMEGFSKVTRAAAKATAKGTGFGKLLKEAIGSGSGRAGAGYVDHSGDNESDDGSFSVELKESRPGAMFLNTQTLKSMMRRESYTPADEHVLDNEEETSTGLGTFEIVSSQKTSPCPRSGPTKTDIDLGTGSVGASPSPGEDILSKQQRMPVGALEFNSFFDPETGRMIKEKLFRQRVFFGGMDKEIRKEGWKYLLGFYPYNASFAEKEQIQRQKEQEYIILKTQWQSVSKKQMSRFSKFKEFKHRIEKDVVRTDRSHPFFEDGDGEGGEPNKNVILLFEILFTYSFFNFDLGYVQGMSDLLSPILYIMEGDEVESFWCFANYMERMENNFAVDQNGMHSHLNNLRELIRVMDPRLFKYLEKHEGLNLFFCFRWLLINFKREFEFEDVIRLWEAFFSEHLSYNFPLFVSLAVLDTYKSVIYNRNMEFDDILKFINDLSGDIGLENCLRKAELLVYKLGKMDCTDELRPLLRPYKYNNVGSKSAAESKPYLQSRDEEEHVCVHGIKGNVKTTESSGNKRGRATKDPAPPSSELEPTTSSSAVDTFASNGSAK
eukprot:Nk52_evm51s2367 gene=Nk52_evmTU51s2367